jgi:hypothetical protein
VHAHEEAERAQQARELEHGPVADRLHADHEPVERQREQHLVRGLVRDVLDDQRAAGREPRREAFERLRHRGLRQVVHEVQHVDGVERALVAPAQHVLGMVAGVGDAQGRRAPLRHVDAARIQVDAGDAALGAHDRVVEREEPEAAAEIQDLAALWEVLTDRVQEALAQDQEAHARIGANDRVGLVADDRGDGVAAPHAPPARVLEQLGDASVEVRTRPAAHARAAGGRAARLSIDSHPRPMRRSLAVPRGPATPGR